MATSGRTGRKKVDVVGLERDYRAGVISIRQLATVYGCSEAYVCRIAKREGWERDLTSEVRKAARSAPTRDSVREDLARGSDVTDEQAVNVAWLALEDEAG